MKRVGILSNKKINIKKIKAIAFDLDGTVYLGNYLVEGIKPLISFLKGKKIRVFYFTNNSVKSRKEIFEKLRGLGLKLSLTDVYNSAYATARYLLMEGIYKVYCLGSSGLKQELGDNGIIISRRKAKVDAVVIGLDTKFKYSSISNALQVIKRGAKLIACNMDANYPTGENRLLPGCGSLVAAVETASGKKADYAVGKPNTFMLNMLAEDYHLKNNEILVVGDMYESDIAMAKKYGSPAVLVLNNSDCDKQDAITVNETKDLFFLIA